MATGGWESVAVPGMPLFEPSADARAAAALRSMEQAAGNEEASGDVFSFPADELFWSNFVIEAVLDDRSLEQPVYKVTASHSTESHLVNQTWMRGFVKAWEGLNPYFVSVSTKFTESFFHGSREFWRSCVDCFGRAQPQGEPTVTVRSVLDPSTVLKASLKDWNAFCVRWEADNTCSNPEKMARLRSRQVEVEEANARRKRAHAVRNSQRAIEAGKRELVEVQARLRHCDDTDRANNSNPTRKCGNCAGLEQRVAQLEHLLNNGSVPVTPLSPIDPRQRSKHGTAAPPQPPSPFLPPHPQQQHHRRESLPGDERQRVRALRDIKVVSPHTGLPHVVAVYNGTEGTVMKTRVDERGGTMYHVKFDTRADDKQAALEVSPAWVAAVVPTAVAVSPLAPGDEACEQRLRELFEELSVGVPARMTKRAFVQLLTERGLLAPEAAYEIFRAVRHPGDSTISYSTFREQALPRAAQEARNTHLIYVLLCVPTFSSAART
eukprot:gene4460-6908_t